MHLHWITCSCRNVIIMLLIPLRAETSLICICYASFQPHIPRRYKGTFSCECREAPSLIRKSVVLHSCLFALGTYSSSFTPAGNRPCAQSEMSMPPTAVVGVTVSAGPSSPLASCHASVTGDCLSPATSRRANTCRMSSRVYHCASERTWLASPSVNTGERGVPASSLSISVRMGSAGSPVAKNPTRRFVGYGYVHARAAFS